MQRIKLVFPLWMKGKQMRPISVSFGAIFLLIILDVATKIVARSFGLGVLNPGVTLGYFGDIPGGLWIAVQVGILAILIIWLIRSQPKSSTYSTRLTRCGAVLLIAGGIGNLISRVLWDGVWDWIAFGSWFHFNLADAMIDIGIVLFLIGYISRYVVGARYGRLPKRKDKFS